MLNRVKVDALRGNEYWYIDCRCGEVLRYSPWPKSTVKKGDTARCRDCWRCFEFDGNDWYCIESVPEDDFEDSPDDSANGGDTNQSQDYEYQNMHWVCMSCGTENPGDIATCPQCHKERNTYRHPGLVRRKGTLILLTDDNAYETLAVYEGGYWQPMVKPKPMP